MSRQRKTKPLYRLWLESLEDRWAPAAGILDPLFSQDGRLALDLNPVDQGVTAPMVMAIQEDGKTIVAGNASAGNIAGVQVFRVNTDGKLDMTFSPAASDPIYDGGDGMAWIGSNTTYLSDPEEILIQKDGKIILVGNYSVVRLHPDGRVDTSFGTGGYVRTVTTAGGPLVSTSGHFYSAALQEDGKILLAGSTVSNSLNSDMVLARLNPQGTWDSTFGSAGVVLTHINGGDEGYDVAIQKGSTPSDFKIVMAGSTRTSVNGSYPQFAAARYNPNGTLDTTFAGDGTFTADLVTGTNAEVAYTVTLQKNGGIILAGSSGFTSNTDFMAVRLNPDGTLDHSFGVNGVGIYTLGVNASIAYSAEVDKNDRIILGGWASTYHFAVARLTSNGGLDLTFNGTGSMVTQPGLTVSGSNNTIARDVGIRPDGSIVMSGCSYVVSPYEGTQAGTPYSTTNVTLQVLKEANGLPDSSFSDDGFGYYNRPRYSSDDGTAVAIQSDGKAVVVGSTGQFFGSYDDFAVARINQDGTPDKTFGGDGDVAITFGGGSSSSEDNASAVLIQGDKIIVLGSTNLQAVDEKMALVRLDATGTVDTSFGGDGTGRVVINPSTGSDLLFAGALQGEKILVGGYTTIGGLRYSTVVRLDKDGIVDPTFASSGTWTQRVDTYSTYSEQVSAILVQEDEKIIVVQSGSSLYSASTVLRLTKNGQLDTSFGTNGFQVYAPLSPTGVGTQKYSAVALNTAALDPDGGIVVGGAGQISGLARDGFVGRLTKDGQRVLSFDGDGVKLFSISNGSDEPNGIAVQQNGRIVVSAKASPSVNNYEFGTARFNIDGSFDTTFGFGGVATYDLSGTAYGYPDVNSNDFARGMALEKGGNLVIVGYGAKASGINAAASDLEVIRVIGDQLPIDIGLSPSSLWENAGANATVGTLTTTDPDAGDTPTYTLVSGPGSSNNSAFTIVGNQLKALASFDHEATPTQTVRVRTTDQTGSYYEEAFTITVLNVNEAPVALADAFTTDEDVTLTGPANGLLANDSDPDGDGMVADLVIGPAHGTLVLFPNGSFTYTPDEDWNGTDTFTYQARDTGGLVSSVVTVSLVVNPVEDLPEAAEAFHYVTEDTTATISLFGDDGDPEINQRLTFEIVSEPMHGNLTIVNAATGAVEYTPNANYFGPDSFTYRVSDGAGWSTSEKIMLMVAPVNDAPVATGEAYAILEDKPFALGTPGVLTNDVDIDGDDLTASLVTGPLYGTLDFNADGSFTYSPAPNWNGIDSFTYQAVDPSGALSSVVTVRLEVLAVEDPAKAQDEFPATDEDVALSIQLTGDDGDPELDQPLTFGLRFMPEHGTLSGFNPATGTVTYTPDANWNGTDSFTFVVDDGNGWSSPATVTIAVASVNDAPELQNNRFYLEKNTSLTGLDLFNTSCDSHRSAPGEGNGPFDLRILTQPNHGQLELKTDGTVNFRPTEGFVGIDGFTVQVIDSFGATSNVASIWLSIYEEVTNILDQYLDTPTHQVYSINGMPDFDQRRKETILTINDNEITIKGFENDGNKFCVPTSIGNVMAYIGNHGYPTAFSGMSTDWDPKGDLQQYLSRYNTSTWVINELADNFDIDPFAGGSANSDQYENWFEQRGLGGMFTFNYYDRSKNLSIKSMTESAGVNCLLTVSIGTYQTTESLLKEDQDTYNSIKDYPSDFLWRVGGHGVTLVGTETIVSESDPGRFISINDPADDSDRLKDPWTVNTEWNYTQSFFSPERYKTSEESKSFGDLEKFNIPILFDNGFSFTKPYPDSKPSRLNRLIEYSSETKPSYIDGYGVLQAKFLVSYDTSLPELDFLSSALTGSGSGPVVSYPTVNGEKVVDAALMTNRLWHPYITESSDTVWRINQRTGESKAFATLEGPKRLATDQQNEISYVLESRHLTALDSEGGILARILLTDSSMDSITFDDQAGQLIAYSSASGKLFRFDQSLSLQSTFDLGPDTVPGSLDARTQIGIDPKTGAIWLHKEGATEIVRVLQTEAGISRNHFSFGKGCGSYVNSGVPIDFSNGPKGMAVDSRGHVLFTLAGKVFELDQNGALVDSIFTGLPAKNAIQVSKSVSKTNFQPNFSYRNLPPNEIPITDAGINQTTKEGNEVTLTGSFIDPDEFDNHTFLWNVVSSNGNLVAQSTNISFKFTPLDDDIYTATLTVTDSSYRSGSDSVLITALNADPTGAWIENAQTTEGSPTTVTFSHLLDAQADLEAGLHFSFTLNPRELAASYAASQLAPAAAFTFADNGTYTVYGRIIDKDGGHSDYSTTVTVLNVPQSVTITGVPTAPAPAGTPLTFGSSVTDPGADAPFTYAWSLNGGPTLATGTGFTFTPALVGTNTVTLTVMDKDGVTVTTSASFSITAPPPSSSPGVRLSPAGILEIIGTDYRDQVIVELTKGGSRITVKASFPKRDGEDDQDCHDKKDDQENDEDRVYSFDARLVRSIRAELRGGNDHLLIQDKILVPATVSGGPGNDNIQSGGGNDTLNGDEGNDLISGGDGQDLIRGGTGADNLNGNAGDDIVLGGDGDDKLLGESGRDLLIGGTGADRIDGNQGDDILIAGYTSFDEKDNALIAIMTEWRSEKTYQQRVENITNGTGLTAGYRLNGKDGPLQTVFDDNEVDILTGSQGMDWFFANLVKTKRSPLDILTDRNSTEWGNDID